MAAAVPPRQEWVRGPVIGRGATATVSLATCPVTGSWLAVKSVDLRHSASLQREQRFLASIPPSPHVVGYLGFNVSTPERQDGAAICHLFLELAPGGSVADEIARFGRLGQSKLRGFTRDILLGLAHLHSNGIAHCDIKPGNVLLDGGACKVADLGCAKWVDGGSAADTVVVGGSPMYMAPEVARGEAQGTAADVWALGCTVLEMATGRPPWPDARDPVAAMHRIGFSGDVPGLPEGLEDEARDFLGKCLVRDPAERWSAEELLAHPFASSSSSCCGTTKDGFFVFSLDDDCNWQCRRPSPKCVLDGDDLWSCSSSASTSSSTWMGDFEAEEGRQHNEHAAASSLSSTARDRIGQLAGPSSPGSWSAATMSCSSWAWDWNKFVEDDNGGGGGGGWITIRESSDRSGSSTDGPLLSSGYDSEPRSTSLTALPDLAATSDVAAVTVSSRYFSPCTSCNDYYCHLRNPSCEVEKQSAMQLARET